MRRVMMGWAICACFLACGDSKEGTKEAASDTDGGAATGEVASSADTAEADTKEVASRPARNVVATAGAAGVLSSKNYTMTLIVGGAPPLANARQQSDEFQLLLSSPALQSP